MKSSIPPPKTPPAKTPQAAIPTRTAQDADKYIVRFPPGMRDKIAEAAKENNRSMNSEIVERLSGSFTNSPDQALKSLEVQATIIKFLGTYLKQTAAMAKAAGSPNIEVLSIMESFGGAIHADDFPSAMDALVKMTELPKSISTSNLSAGIEEGVTKRIPRTPPKKNI